MSIVVLSACMVVIALAALFAGYSFGSAKIQEKPPLITNAAPMIEEIQPAATPVTPVIQITEPPAPSGTISIPGFELLTVQGTRFNAENIVNSTNNKCYFIVAIILADGSEVYRSGILSPGESVGTVNLTRTLAPGKHEGSIARYSCYALETMQTLNGADVNFTLEVLP